MKPRSITFKLTIWYTGIFLASSIFVGLIFYWETKKELIHQTDMQITSHAQQIISQGTIPDMPGMYITKTTKPNRIIFKEGPIQGTVMRYGIFPASNSGIIVAHPIVAVNEALHKLIWQLVLAAGGVGLLGISGGILLAKNALRPVTRLASEMESLSVTNLNKPVSVPSTGDEISSLAQSFNRLLDRLASSFARERQFIGDVAHELKNPLATLISNAELNHDNSNNLKELKRLSATINDVLDLAWAQSGEVTTQFTRIDLSQLVSEVVEMAGNLGVRKKIKVVAEVASGISVMGIRQKLFRAIYNLADNAVKYTPTDEKVAISLRQKDDLAILEVSNTGPGISSDDLPLVFKRFYRGKNPNSTGTGLGLSISKSIIEAHRGTINIDSKPNKITTFAVRLPLD